MCMQAEALVCMLNQAVRPVTPRASAAPPGAGSAESAAPGGVFGRVLPAGVLGNRFQHLFKGKGECVIAAPLPYTEALQDAHCCTAHHPLH